MNTLNYPSQFLQWLAVPAVLCLSILEQGFAQELSAPEEIQAKRERNLRQFEDQQFVAQVISGRQYFHVRAYWKSQHHFAYNINPEPGSLLYDGILYENQKIQYDAFRQLVVLVQTTPKNEQFISIDNNKVGWFTMSDRVYVVFEDSVLNKAIYQKAYDQDGIKYMIQHRKAHIGQSHDQKYGSENLHYLITDKGSFRLKKKKDFFMCFDEPKRIIAILKKNQVWIRKKHWSTDIPLALDVICSTVEVKEQ